MTMKAVCCLLAFSLAQGSVIPSTRSSLSSEINSVVSNLSPISSLASLSPAWDREYTFTRLGLDVKVAFASPSSVAEGGLVRLSWAVPSLLTPFTWGLTSLDIDVVMQTQLNLGRVGIKAGYKVVKSGDSMEGTVSLSRKAELGMFTTQLVLTQGGTSVLEVGVESDMKNKVLLSATVQGKTHHLRINRVRGNSYMVTTPAMFGFASTTLVISPDTIQKKITIMSTTGKTTTHKAEIIYNPISTEYGLYLSGDFNGPVLCRLIIAKDLKFAQAILSYNEVDYVHTKIEGRMTGMGLMPSLVKYTVSYDINQGQWGEGTAKIVFNGIDEHKRLSVSVVPKTGHALDFTLKATVEADWSVEVSHELVRDRQIIYTMAHKTEVLENSATKFEATHVDKCSIPTTSPAYKFTQGNYIGNILQNMKRKMVVSVDWTVKNGMVYGVHFKESVMAAGKSHLNVFLDTMTAPYRLSVYYPVGPEFIGTNLGLRYLIHQDKVSAEITHMPKKEVVIKTDIKNIIIRVNLPNCDATPVFAVDITHSNLNEKAIEWVVYRDGLVYKLNMFSNIRTTTLPYICTLAGGCTWTTNINFDIDFGTLIAGLVPVHTLATTITRNTESLLEIQHSVKSSPFFCRVTCPLVLPTPLHITIDYQEGKEMTISAPTFLPMDINVDIEGTKHIIAVEGLNVAIIDINIPMKQIFFELPLVAKPIAVITWTKTGLTDNVMTIKTTLPIVQKVTELQTAWTVKTPLAMTLSGFLKSDLPILGTFQVTHDCAVAATWWTGSARTMVSMTGTTVPAASFAEKLEYDVSARALTYGAKMTYEGQTVEVSY